MFDIGFIEILTISIVALIVIGPERLPAVARTLGHLLGRARHYVSGIKTDIHNEMRMDELKHLHTSVQETADTIKNSVRQEIDEIKSRTDIKNLTTTTSPSSTETKVDSAILSTQPASQQQTSTSGEQQSTLEKDNK